MGRAGAALTVVTLGGRASRWRAATGEEAREGAREGDVVDTVGAGDSFMAGLVSGLLDAGLLGGPVPASDCEPPALADVAPPIDRALATSGITVRRAGAYAPTREEL